MEEWSILPAGSPQLSEVYDLEVEASLLCWLRTQVNQYAFAKTYRDIHKEKGGILQ